MKFNFHLFTLLALATQDVFCRRGAMAANERLFITPDVPEDPGFGGAKPGIIYAANEGMLQAAWKSGNVFDAQAANDGNLAAGTLALHQPLSDFTTGIRDRENLIDTLNRISPMCPVGGIFFDYLQEAEEEEFQKRSLANIERPVHGEFPERKITGTQTTGRVKNYGLVTYLDRDQGGMLPRLQQAQVASTRNIILRSLIADAFAQLDANAATDTSKNWNDAASNPDGDARAMVKATGDARGVDANVFAYGNGAWHYRLNAYEKPDRVNGGNHADWTPDRVAQYLQVDDAYVSKTRYRDSTTSLAPIVDATLYAYFAREGLMAGDSSNIKRFQFVGDGGDFRVWIEVGTHRVKIIVDCQCVNKITSSVGIRKRVITWS
jgi:hypothetical protein